MRSTLGRALPILFAAGITRILTSFPVSLQDHGHPVRFRNIWLRPLEGGR